MFRNRTQNCHVRSSLRSSKRMRSPDPASINCDFLLRNSHSSTRGTSDRSERNERGQRWRNSDGKKKRGGLRHPSLIYRRGLLWKVQGRFVAKRPIKER